MSTWVVLPVKPLSLAKSRLAEALSAEQRERFAEGSLKRVLGILKLVPQLNGILVISRDTKVLGIARDFGVKTVQESGQPALNPALMRATQLLQAWGAESVLVLPADLPLLETEDVIGVIRAAKKHEKVVVISTDRHRDGTNALFVRPPGLLTYDYGVGSFTRHKQQAESIGVPIVEVDSPNIQLDLDVPEDVVVLYKQLLGHDMPRQMPLSEAFESILATLERGELH